MKVPLSWLQEFITVPTEPSGLATFCDGLTMAGLEVEEILEGPTLYTKVTPNRGDWASILGTAREAAAVDPALTLTLPTGLQVVTGAGPIAVEIEYPDACARYAATVIRGVTIKPAPDWLQLRLTQALGDKYKPVNNIVDITNYVMIELGQPLHAFDLATIAGGKIIVRHAKSHETLTTLDGEERDLTDALLCICDAEKPVALAGIMGGLHSEISPTTVDILLEAAHFDPITIRRGSKALGLASEASYRFERFVDPNLVLTATQRAAALILELAGGTLDGKTTDCYAKPHVPVRVLARLDRVRKLLGVDVDRDDAVAALVRLGIDPERSAGALDCLIPSFRPDISIEEDIAEEIGRIALGYDKLPETVPPVTTGRGKSTPRAVFAASVRTVLTRLGMQDIVGHSLVAAETAWTEAERASMVLIRNPMAPQYAAMRTSLFATLLPIAGRAVTSGIRDFSIFELGSIYQVNQGEYAEPQRLSGILSGSRLSALWGTASAGLPSDVYAAKGIVIMLLQHLGLHDIAIADGRHPIGHPFRTATVTSNGQMLGSFGEIRTGVTLLVRDSDTGQLLDIAADIPPRSVFFDLDADMLLALSGHQSATYVPLSKFPTITRDLAPVLPKEGSFGTILDAMIAAAGPFCRSAVLIDLYAGLGIPEGYHAPTIRFVFQAFDRTLVTAEVDTAMNSIRSVCEGFGAQIR